MYLKTAVTLCALSFSISSLAATQNYIEYGVGATQIHSLRKGENKDLTDYSFGSAAKILIAGRIDRSANTWFELAYSYNDGISYRDNTLSSQFLSAGIKFTTNPYNGVSSFLKLGGGRTIFTYQTTGEADETDYDHHFYLGTGFSFRLNNRQAVNFEIQRFGRDGADTGINNFLINFNQFI